MRISDVISDVGSSDLGLHLAGDMLHVPRGQELALLDVHGAPGFRRGQQQVGLSAQKCRDLQDIDRLGHRIALPWFVDVGDDRATISFANFRQYRSEEHTSELQSLMRISYAVFCLKKKQTTHINEH